MGGRSLKSDFSAFSRIQAGLIKVKIASIAEKTFFLLFLSWNDWKVVPLTYRDYFSLFLSLYSSFELNLFAIGTVVVAQLVERLLLIPEVGGSIPVIGKILKWTYLLLAVETTYIKKKEAVNMFASFNLVSTQTFSTKSHPSHCLFASNGYHVISCIIWSVCVTLLFLLGRFTMSDLCQTMSNLSLSLSLSTSSTHSLLASNHLEIVLLISEMVAALDW